ncbi:sugar ABC transporter ATP-binding protein [Brevibacillus fluminis]|uniref:sugar ABC transporter ATP-binding protein n=1 Tax=Brevibacillus fluminis TaxID=511487 RepID=UPI003F8A59AC
MRTAALKMERISKRFPGVKALDEVNIEAHAGEILALLGENGAGKSTLMKVLAGVHQPDSGEIYINGQKAVIHGPRQSQELGISIIYQEFNLIPHVSIAENIYLGREPRKCKGVIDWKKLNAMAKAVMDRVGLTHLQPQKRVEQLSIAEQQLVEIAKALSHASQILIMDEPTAVLNGEDAQRLLAIMGELREQGMAIIFITHRLEEVEQVADRIAVLRDGKYVGSAIARELTREQMVRMMVGRDIAALYPERNRRIGEPVLKVEHLSLDGKLSDINLTVRAGEILGIGGLMGSGSTTLSKALFGLYPQAKGTITVDGKSGITSPKAAIDAGIALVTDDRKGEGLVLIMSVFENLLLPSYRRISSFGTLLEKSRASGIVERWIAGLKIKVHNPAVAVGTLSGGNQQKVVLGKWLQMNPKVLILNEPTRGIDVGAKAEIYQFMKALSEEGLAIIMISSEMPELLGMAHRIAVMHEGRITGEMPIEEATQEKIFIYATGGERG